MEILMNNNEYDEILEGGIPQEQPQELQEQPQEEQTYAYQQFATDYSTVGLNVNNEYAYNSGYTKVGSTVIDSNGKELKNYFGLKLTLSILEMLCCCASCATLVLGIIACVFTCKANTCYKEGRYDEFKTKAKTATILLIIGAAAAVIGTVSTSILSLPEFEGMFEDLMYEFQTMTALF
jgi:hypothetical protein